MRKKQLSQQVSVHALMLMGYDLVMLAIVSAHTRRREDTRPF